MRVVAKEQLVKGVLPSEARRSDSRTWVLRGVWVLLQLATGVNPAGDAGDTSPQYFCWGGRQREYPPILLRTFGYKKVKVKFSHTRYRACCEDDDFLQGLDRTGEPCDVNYSSIVDWIIPTLLMCLSLTYLLIDQEKIIIALSSHISKKRYLRYLNPRRCFFTFKLSLFSYLL